MSSLNVTLTQFKSSFIFEVKTLFFCPKKDIQLSKIAPIKNKMLRKLKGIEKNQQKALEQGNVTLTHFFLFVNFAGKIFPSVILADVAIQE